MDHVRHSTRVVRPPGSPLFEGHRRGKVGRERARLLSSRRVNYPSRLVWVGSVARRWSRQQATRHIISKRADKEVRSRRKSLRELSNVARHCQALTTSRHKFAASHPEVSVPRTKTHAPSNVRERNRDKVRGVVVKFLEKIWRKR